MNRMFVSAIVVVAAAGIKPVGAEGRTVKLTFAGPGIAGAIDVTAPAALANVWGGEFLAGPAAERH
jgi:hypothetical protein